MLLDRAATVDRQAEVAREDQRRAEAETRQGEAVAAKAEMVLEGLMVQLAVCRCR